jgi:hypothetical protein
MAKGTAGISFKENLSINNLGFLTACAAAVVRYNDYQRSKASLWMPESHLHMAVAERSALTPHSDSNGRCAWHASSWCGLQVLRADLEGSKCKLMRGHRAIIDLQWQSVLSHRVQPSQDHKKSAVIAAASSLCLQAGSPPRSKMNAGSQVG